MGRRKHSPARRSQAKSSAPRQPKERVNTIWLYGYHAVLAALENPKRDVARLVAIEPAAKRLRSESRADALEIVERRELSQLLPPGVTHQGFALETTYLPEVTLTEVLEHDAAGQQRLLVLDQVSDPRNVGAMLRSAAAFEADALVLTHRHAPPESGALAKAASGALETVPIVRVSNLAQSLEELAKLGFWRVGLDANAAAELTEIDLSGNLALILGAEGAGLRRLTAARCDVLARLPMAQNMASLNVSNAAAIALFLSFMTAHGAS